MKKFTKYLGVIGVISLVGSVVFKGFHLMGAPTLLLIGTIGIGLYIVLFFFQRISAKAQ